MIETDYYRRIIDKAVGWKPTYGATITPYGLYGR